MLPTSGLLKRRSKLYELIFFSCRWDDVKAEWVRKPTCSTDFHSWGLCPDTSRLSMIELGSSFPNVTQRYCSDVVGPMHNVCLKTTPWLLSLVWKTGRLGGPLGRRSTLRTLTLPVGTGFQRISFRLSRFRNYSQLTTNAFQQTPSSLWKYFYS